MRLYTNPEIPFDSKLERFLFQQTWYLALGISDEREKHTMSLLEEARAGIRDEESERNRVEQWVLKNGSLGPAVSVMCRGLVAITFVVH